MKKILQFVVLTLCCAGIVQVSLASFISNEKVVSNVDEQIEKEELNLVKNDLIERKLRDLNFSEKNIKIILDVINRSKTGSEPGV